MKKGLYLAVFCLSLFALTLTNSHADEKTYTIVFDSTYAPFEFQNENGEYEGIDVALLDKIAETEGFKVEKKFPGFQAAVDQVQAGQADGIIAGMSITDERKEKFDFSSPYFNSSIEIAIQSDTKGIKTLADLDGKKVGAKNGTISQQWLTDHQKEYGYEIVTFDDGSTMYDALNVKFIIAMMDDAPVIDYAIAQKKDFKVPFEPVPVGQYGFAVKKGQNQELLKMFNAGLAKLKANGGYDAIVNQYVGKKAKNNTQTTSKEATFIGLIQNNYQAFLKGLGKTLAMALVSFVFAMAVGIIIGLFSVAPIKGLRLFSTVYVDLIRGVPLMVLAYFIFYGVGHMNDFAAGVLALTLNASAYIAEIVRGGINAVPTGQMEASRSLGLGYTLTMRKIILPQATRIMLPSFVNQFVISLKDTTIISVLGVVELLQAGKIIVARNFQTFNVYLIVGLMYLIVITLLTKLSKFLEKKVG